MEETTEIATRSGAPPPADTNILVAMTPGAVVDAKARLLVWADEKIAQAERDAEEMGRTADIAERNGFAHAGARRHAKAAVKNVEFYQKIRAAVEDGYVIVPNFPIDVFAVRTAKARPSADLRSGENYQPRANDIESEAPPVGAGRYVSDTPLVELDRYEEPHTLDPKKTVVMRTVKNVGFYGVDFPIPIQLVAPQIIEATGEAMRKLIFDEIGLCSDANPRKDPIVIGRIYSPKRRRAVSFFVGWWIDLRTL